MKFLGCDDNSHVTVNLQDIPSGYQFPKTTDYDSKWGYLAGPDGLFAESQIHSNSIYFDNQGDYGSGNINCYYSIYVPDTGQSMYVKLVNHYYDAASYNSIGLALNKPQLDTEATQQNGWVSQMVAVGPETVISAAAGAGYWYSKAQFNLARYIDSHTLAHYKRYVKKFNQQLALAKQGDNDGLDFIAREMDASKGMALVDPQAPNNSYNIKERCDWLEENVDHIETDVTPIPGSNGGTSISLRMVGKNGNDVQNVPEDIHPASDQSAQYQIDSIRQKTGRNIVSIDDYMQPDDTIFTKGDNFTSQGFHKKQALYKRNGSRDVPSDPAAYASDDYLDMGTEMKIGFYDSEFVSGDVASAGIGTAVMLVQWFGIQPFINGITSAPGVGNFNTGVNHIYFAQVTDDDVKNWNAKASAESQISANTRVDETAANSVMQSTRLTFSSSSDIDQNVAVNLQLNALTTPWVRYEKYSSDDGQSDPYLGCTDKQDKSCSGGTTHKASAVATLTITDNSVSPTKDLDASYSTQAMSAIGIGSLSTNRLLPPPTYVVNSLKDSKSNKLLKSSSDLNSYLALSPGQDALLTVTIPKTANGVITSGAGYNVTYVPDDSESTPLDFIEVKSLAMLQKLTSQPSESSVNLPVLYSQFGCAPSLAVGSGCPLKLSLRGYDDGKRHTGKLYLADTNSSTTAIPVYVKYRLMAEPMSLDLTQGDRGNGNIIIKVYNLGGDDYKQVQLGGDSISGASIVSNGCTNGIAAGGQCTIEYDLSRADQGNFTLMLYGITNSNIGKPLSAIKEKDIQPIAINISGGF